MIDENQNNSKKKVCMWAVCDSGACLKRAVMRACGLCAWLAFLVVGACSSSDKLCSPLGAVAAHGLDPAIETLRGRRLVF